MDTGDRVARERMLRRAVLDGDEVAWQQWYDEEFSALFAYVAWRCGGLRDLMEDVAQETWLIAVRRIRRFRPEHGPFQAWLRGIASNVVRNRLRGLRRQRTTPLTTEPLVAPGQYGEFDRDQAEHVARTLAALPVRYEAVLRAKYLDQQAVAQIAADWNETPKAIESLLTRARQAFREVYPHPGVHHE